MADVTLRYGANRKAEPLTEQERNRLRTLAGKGRRSPQEQFELGSLRGRARHDPAGRRLLDDVAHGQAARSQPVTARRANSMVAKAVADAIRQRLDEED
jgi:hypothetical protein